MTVRPRLRIGRHRRFTANHTWHLDLGQRELFVKLNPNHAEAAAEIAGHAALRGHYPMPELLGHRRLPGATVLLYRRLPHLDRDTGLLLDVLAHAETTGDHTDLTTAAAAFTGHYRRVATDTARQLCGCEVVGKLYRDRAAPGGRLETYHHGVPWLLLPDGHPLYARDLATTPLRVNGRPVRLDFDALVQRLRATPGGHRRVWSVLAQGDPTAFNLAWHPSSGPMWLDYDTAGCSPLPGEFAVMLADLWIHGAWLTPVRAPAAYRDHPTALAAHRPPVARVHRRGDTVVLDVDHRPSPARAALARAWLDDLVHPVAADLDIDDLTEWLRPWLAMRLLTVHRPADLPTGHAALLLAAVADLLDPDTDPTTLLTAPAAPTTGTTTPTGNGQP